MKRGALAVTLVLGVVASAVTIAPGAAAGGRMAGHGFVSRPSVNRFVGAPVGSRSFVNGHSGNRSFGGAPFHGHGFHGHGFFPNRRFGPFFPCCGGAVVYPGWWGYGAYADYSYYDPTLAYAPAPAYASSPVYAPPAVYGVDGSVSVAPAPPTPRVVEFPTGRYELRGDGVTSPYTWVWVPNPPSAPPAPPPDPPGSPSSRAPSTRVAAAPRAELYCWTDERGVTTWTDQWDSLPERVRKQVKEPDGSGKATSERSRLLCLEAPRT
jgi:hypothetical protein